MAWQIWACRTLPPSLAHVYERNRKQFTASAISILTLLFPFSEKQIIHSLCAFTWLALMNCPLHRAPDVFTSLVILRVFLDYIHSFSHLVPPTRNLVVMLECPSVFSTVIHGPCLFVHCVSVTPVFMLKSCDAIEGLPKGSYTSEAVAKQILKR